MHTQDVPDAVANFDDQTRDRFYSFIDIDEETECWIWTGPSSLVGGNAYGNFSVHIEERSGQASAKMLTYELETDGGLPIEPGKETILRKNCQHTLCVNPEHQSVHFRRHKGTATDEKDTDNTRHYEKQDWCDRGLHNLNVPGNRTSNGKQCRRCHNITRRKRVAKMSEEELEAKRREKRERDRKRAERWAERAKQRLRAM